MTFLKQTSRVIIRLAPFAALAGLIAVAPTEANAMLSDGAETAAAYWQELLIAAALISAAVYLDTASWSVMTAKVRRR